MKNPPASLRLFINTYLLFASIGFRKLPGFKGLFFRIYHRIKHKEGVIRLTTNQKIPLYIDLKDDIIATVLIEYGLWEPSLTNLMREHIRPGMTLLDIGAHIGYYTTLMSKLAGVEGRVIAFEPEAYNFSLLRKNAGQLPNCMLVHKGVSNVQGTTWLYLAPGNLGAHSMHQKSEKHVDVETVVLDEFIGDNKVDFIKMDIEGNEPFAIEGMHAILKQLGVKMVFEYVAGYIKEPKRMFDELRSYGFTLFLVSHETGALTQFDDVPTIKEGIVSNIFCVKK